MNRFRKYFFRFYPPHSSCCPLYFWGFPLHRRIHPHSHPRLFFLYPRKTYPCRLQGRKILPRSLRRSVSAPESFSCSCTFPFSSLSPFPGFFAVCSYLSSFPRSSYFPVSAGHPPYARQSSSFSLGITIDIWISRLPFLHRSASISSFSEESSFSVMS